MIDLAPLAHALHAARLALLIGPEMGDVSPGGDEAFCRRLAHCVLETFIPWVLTTRIDTGLAQAFAQAGVDYEPILRDDTLADRDDTLPALIYLFGSPAQPNSLIRTPAEEADLLHDPRRAELRRLLRDIFSSHVVLAYGCDLAAAWFQSLRASFPGGEFPHLVYLVAGGDPDAAAWARIGVYLLPADPLGLLGGPRAPALERYPAEMAPFEEYGNKDTGAEEKQYADIFEELPSDEEHASKGIEDREPPPPVLPALPEIDFDFSTDIPKSISYDYQPLRIDAAAPARVTVGVSFVLAVAVRQLDAPKLQEKELTLVESGEAEVVFATGEEAVRLRLRVNAPTCTIAEPDSYTFRLRRGGNPPPFYFNLTPQQAGPISVIVQLFQEDEWLGGARLQAEADATAPAGAVILQLRSQPLAGGGDFAGKWEMEEKERQRNEARRYLLRLQALLMPPPGAIEQARIEVEIDKVRAQIKRIEEEIDAVMAAAGP